MRGSTAIRPSINHSSINSEHSIGTSKDSFTNKRTVNGDADKYRELATKGANYLSEISGDTIACFKYSVGNTITSPPMTSAAQYVFSDVLGKNLSSAKIKDFCKSSISILSEGTSDSQLRLLMSIVLVHQRILSRTKEQSMVMQINIES
jgi:hypothetical protein